MGGWGGGAQIQLGKVEEGLRLVEEATEERQRIGQRLGLSTNHLVRAEGLWMLRREGDALAAVREAQEAARDAGEESTGMLARELEARILCGTAEPEALRPRLKDYEEVLAQLRRSGLGPDWMRGRLRLSAWLACLGEEVLARPMEQEARALLRALGALDADGSPHEVIKEGREGKVSPGSR